MFQPTKRFGVKNPVTITLKCGAIWAWLFFYVANRERCTRRAGIERVFPMAHIGHRELTRRSDQHRDVT
jgi:lauroyl/myristoyl acyltransferase